MNVKKISLSFITTLSFCLTAWAADSPKALVAEGNRAYQQGDYLAAIDQYDLALTDTPKATYPKFNKANSYFRLDDLDQAVDLFREVAAKAKDMNLVDKANYNLGNCQFQKGMKQRDSNLQQSMTDLEAAIGYWRKTLDINKDNPKAARNIEVARLLIKDIIDQINQQNQNDPNQPQDPNQNQNQQQQPSQQSQPQDPNQPQDQSTDPNEPDDASNQDQPSSAQPEDQQQDPNPSSESQSQPTQQEQEQRPIEQDMNAQTILDKEQRQKQERQMRQKAAYQKVDKDW